MYRCWKDGKPYNEEIYPETCAGGVSLAGALALATSIEWKTVGGFQKICYYFSRYTIVVSSLAGSSDQSL